MGTIMTFIDHIPWSDMAGFLGIAFLVIFIGWFVFNPISRDKVLVKFGWKYFGLVFLIMASCTCLIAWLISKDTLAATDSGNPFMIAIKYCLKMQEAKDAHLNVWAFIFIMLFQIVVFEGLVLAAIVGWTGRRSKLYQKGEIRYSKLALKGIFGRRNYAVVIGANEVAASVIKNLLKPEAEKQSLNYAHEKENQYVILQTSSDVSEVRQILQSYLTENEYERVIIYSDLRNSYEGLAALHLDCATEIYVLGENTAIDGGETYHDTMNMRCVNMMAKILGNRMGDRKVCKILFEYQTTFSIFQFSDVTQEVNESMLFIPFNRYEAWARRVMVDNKALALIDENIHQSKKESNIINYTPLDGYTGIRYADEQRVHFIIIGMSKMGVAMGVQALFQAHYPNYVRDNSLKTRVTFIDANAEQEMQFFKGRYNALFELARHRYIDANICDKAELESVFGWVDPTKLSDYKWNHLSYKGQNFLDVEIEFIKGELESEGVREYLRQVTADKKSKVTIAICLPSTHQSVAAALYMPVEVYRSKYVQDIWVYQREAADIIHNLTHSKDNKAYYAKLKPFGMLYGEYIDSRTYYLKALLVNGIYAMDDEELRTKLDMGNKQTYKDLRTDWNGLSVEKKWSNKYFSDSMYQKMRCAMDGLSQEASVGGYTNSELFGNENWYMTFEFALKHAQGLAECEHNRWNIQQLLLGFTPAEKSIDDKLQTYVKDKKVIPERKSEFKQIKDELKSPRNKIHYCICDFEHLDMIDPGAKDYDAKLNNGIPMILAHVDGYKQKVWYIMKERSIKNSRQNIM